MFDNIKDVVKIAEKWPLIMLGASLIGLVFSTSITETSDEVIETKQEVVKKTANTNYFFLHFNEKTQAIEPVLKYEDIVQNKNFTFYGENLTFVLMHDEPCTIRMSVNMGDRIINQEINPDKRKYEKYKKEVILDSLALQPLIMNSLYIPYEIPYSLSPSGEYRITVLYKNHRNQKQTYKTLIKQEYVY